MKYVKYSQSKCSFCEKVVKEYFTSNSNKVICKECVKEVTELFKPEPYTVVT